MKTCPKLLILILLVSACTVLPTSGRGVPAQTYVIPTVSSTAEPNPTFISGPYPVLTTCNLSSKLGLPLVSGLLDTHILYQGYDPRQLQRQSQLWVVSTKDGLRKLLTDYPPSATGIGFLQDGRQFLISIGYGDEAWLGDITGSPPRKVRLTNELLANFQPYSLFWSDLVWAFVPNASDIINGRYHSPDNKKIAIWNQGDSTLVILDQANQRTTTIMSPVQNASLGIEGSWTSDGKWFVYIYTSSLEQVLIVNSEGTDVRTLATSNPDSIWDGLEISPDNKKIAFSIIDTKGSLKSAVGILYLDTGEMHVYSLENFSLEVSTYLAARSLVWSPNSQWVAFFTSREDSTDIRAMNINNGNIYCITNDSIQKVLMDWR